MAGTDPGFRRASETRALPETPKEMRSRWMSEARRVPMDSSVVTYGPNRGPVNNPPLTRDQASKLLDAAKFPSKLSKYREKFISTIIAYSTKLPLTERRRFDILLKLAGNDCITEILVPLFDNFENQLNTTIEYETSFGESRGVSPSEIKENIERINSTLFLGVASFLVDGFDVVDYKDYIFDKDGNITGLVPSRSVRKPLCAESFKRGPLTIYKDPTDFKEFLQKQSDPFKGSQQGVGRKTRKHKRNQKKTSRRRKMRRNMH